MISHKYQHTEPLFTKLEVLSLLKLYHLHIVLFMFKFSNCLLPEIYKDMFVINRNIHQHSTRQQNKLHVPKCRTNMLKKSLFYKGVLIWNLISTKIEDTCTIQSFKWQLKKYLLYNDIDV